MKQKLSTTLALVVLTMALAAGTARAQTVANGPYYANPSWDQTLACATLATCPRFIVLSNMNSEAVLDRETGLVWEKSPATNPIKWEGGAARQSCITKNVGGRKGWRLPSVQELASLVDPSVPSPGPTLPAGHPFINVGVQIPVLHASPYWSATTFADFPTVAWLLDLNSGNVTTAGKAFELFVWCVRGGGVLDNY